MTAASRTLWLSRLFYAADGGVGLRRRAHCPSCGSRDRAALRSPGGWWSLPFECRACGLYFRPTGLLGGAVAEFYYSHLYEAGLATSAEASRDGALREELIASEGKDRNALVAELFGAPPQGQIGVFGCSWGYEVLALRNAGYDAFGIELSDQRREWGTTRLGLPLYASVAAAAAAGRAPALVLSSHVLEHIPRLQQVLDDIHRTLRPRRYIHITPFVEDYRSNASRRPIIGREHPLGVTTRFWRGWAQRQGLHFRSEIGGRLPGTVDSELVAVLSAA